MAKEIIPPDPIPVGENVKIDDNDFCASFMNYSGEAYSDTSKDLLQYLESEYGNVGFGGSTRTFTAHNTTRVEVWHKLEADIGNNVLSSNIAKHIFMTESGNDVLITLMLY